MAKKLIFYEGKFYKLNNEALRILISENSNVGPEAQIREIIKKEDMGEMFQTIKNWYYGTSGTQDIQSLKKIAHFYDVPVTKILTETDQTWEYIEEAKNKPNERTYEAAKEIIRRNFYESPVDDPDYEQQKGFKKFNDRIPKSMPRIFLFYFVFFWTCTLDFRIFMQIAPVMIFFTLEYIRFFINPYFMQKKSTQIWRTIIFLLETTVLIKMFIDIAKHYFL